MCNLKYAHRGTRRFLLPCGKLNALTLALGGVLAVLAAPVVQAQTISNNQTTVQYWNAGDFLVTSSGTLIVPGTAIQSSGANLGTLTNNGVISGTNGAGIENTGFIRLINNAGTISGSFPTENGGGNGILNDGTIVTLTNSGTIQGGNDRVIYNTGFINELNNSGLITGPTSGFEAPIYNGGTIQTLNNSGTLYNAAYGVQNSGTIAVLENSGLISGSIAINNSSGNIGSIINTGTIAGNIVQASNDLNISGGSGNVFGTLTGFQGAIGAITSTSSNVDFTGGNLLLNDNVNVGTNTVNNVGSTLQVNNPITISGNYNQSAGGAGMQFGVASTETYGHLTVNGSTTIASGSHIGLVPLNSYGLAAGQRYVVISSASASEYNAANLQYSGFAGGSITGSEVSDSENGAYTDLVLTLVSNTPAMINQATTPNARAVLGGLANYGGENASLLNVFNAVQDLPSAAALNQAGAQLSPAATASAAIQASAATSQAVAVIALSHLDSLREGQSGSGSSGVASGEQHDYKNVWAQVFGGNVNQSDRDNVAGYSGNYHGLLFGADVPLNDQWRGGGLFSYGRTSLSNSGDNDGSSASVNTYGLMAYATYTGDPWYVNILTGAAQQHYDTTRAINFAGFSGSADGSFNGRQYMTALEYGYPINIDPGVYVTPLAALSYTALHQNAYTESGGNGAALSVNSENSNSFRSELGIKLETFRDTSYGKLSPLLKIGWRHEFENSGLQTTANFANDNTGATSFAVEGTKPISDTMVFSLGLGLMQTDQFQLAVHYTVETGSGYNNHTGDLQAIWKF